MSPATCEMPCGDWHLVQAAAVPEPAVFPDIQDGESGSESGKPVRSADASTFIGMRTNPAGFPAYLARTGAGESVGEETPMTRRQRVTFGSAAGIPLAGWLDLPDGDPTAVALFAHCFTCGQVGPAAARIARGLTDRGIAVLRCDFTGLGEPAGESAATTFSSSIEDLGPPPISS